MEIDYLIIGQGLAGSLLAWELIQRQKKIIIVDNAKENASLMAAGLINPVTGMRWVKSENVDLLLPVALAYYQKLARHFQQQFYVEKTLRRVISTEKDLAAAKKRQQQIAYQPYLSQNIGVDSTLYAPWGLINQKQTGYLLCKPLLTALKNYFIAHQAYIKAEINYQDIHLSQQLHWKKWRPKHIIFCEGHHATHNPWFSWLPFQPVKGEIITATATQAIPQTILNYGHWFIPLSTYQFRTGATFDRIQLDTQISTTAKETLLTSLKKVMPTLSINPEIRQEAGIRPTTLDKQPFIGHHPKHPELIIFNGFGAKGSLQIPWYCQCLANNLMYNQAIPENSHIMRYASLSL